jgi:hypothetical protein
MSKKLLPSGTWVRQTLAPDKVLVLFIPALRTKKIQFKLVDLSPAADPLGDNKKQLDWSGFFKDHPAVDIDHGVVTLRLVEDDTVAQVMWIPDIPTTEPVEIKHPVPKPVPGMALGAGAFADCMNSIGLADPAVALTVCALALIAPGA